MTPSAPAEDLISTVARAVVWALRQHGVPEDAARATAATACQELCRTWGGDAHWVPQTFRPGRDAEIARAVANGVPASVISQRMAVSESTVRRVARRQSAGLARDDDWVL